MRTGTPPLALGAAARTPPPLRPRPARRLSPAFPLQVGQVAATLLHRPGALLLLGAQIAATLAILCNVLFLIELRIETMRPPSGMNGADTFRVASTGRRDEVMGRAGSTRVALDHNGVVRNVRTAQRVRADANADDRAMCIVLATVCACLLAVTALGMAGTASLRVSQRARQIGTRRALGATRGSIVRYFLLENALITLSGLAPGVVASYAFCAWLIRNHHTPLLPGRWVAASAAVLLALGQVAVLGPALCAARIPPAVATRKD